jgi:MarR family transcriptional regulator for hemolysin
VNDLQHALGRNLVFTAKALRAAFEEALAQNGGSLGTWIVLSALSDVGCVSQAALATHVHLEGATITHHIDRLESLGLVLRLADPDDRRVHLLELTEAGAELYTRLLAAAKEFENEILAGVSADDRIVLQTALARIRSNITARAEAPSAA